MTADDNTRERGRRRLAAWRRDKLATGGVEIDLTRWESDELLLVLGESAEQLSARLPERPEWLAVLSEAWAHPEPADVDGVLTLAAPLLGHCERQLRRDLGWLAPDHPLFARDTRQLAAMVTPVLVREMHAARDRLTGETPEARFSSFADLLREAEFSLEILSRHPVLARELVTELSTWATVRAEFAVRLRDDLPAILPGLTAADVTAIDFGAGDTHRGGRSVAVVTFGDGRRIVYKPRGLATERHFSALLAWANDRGLRHPLRHLQVFDRGEYGWVEFAEPASCTTEAEVTRFFWRQGAQLALLHALRAQDMHSENLIAAGEHPVFVDLESVFVPPIRAHSKETVLRIGLLPNRVVKEDAAGVRAVDMSGMTGAQGAPTPMPLPHWVDAGTDRMRRERDHLPMPATENRAALGSSTVDPWHHRAELLAGFTDAYRLLVAHRDELLAENGPIAAFSGAEARPILRSSMIYARILLESWHPDVLGDALDRSCLFELLAKGHKEVTGREELIASEIRQLTGRDIPAFTVTVGSRDLCDETGVLVPDFYPVSGLDAVREGIAALGEADLTRQRWCIEASLAALAGDRVAPGTPVVPRPLAPPIDVPTALEAATLIGDRLLDTAIAEDRQPRWLTLRLAAERHWVLAPTALDLYDGDAGIALFLACLTELSGRSRYREAAESITTRIVDATGHLADQPAGMFAELGSAVYTLARLGSLWRSDALLDTAADLVQAMIAGLAEDTELDVMSGTAGAALAISVLHAARPDERTELALLTAGTALLARAERHPDGLTVPTMGNRVPMLGYSHGASGVAVALSRIALATGQDRFAEAATSVLRYEHAQFDRAAGGWPDRRDSTPEDAFMNAWCHGAAGIGLARGELLGVLTDPAVAEDLRRAVAAVRRDLLDETGTSVTGFANDSLCHGTLGLVETMLSDPASAEIAKRVAGTIANSVLAGEFRCASPYGTWIPGLLNGAAGIGYGLLRTAAPDRVPSVLAAGG
ncbi:type 2 lanthipeptide synthetase LanM family protein [Amycolatopsis minnesotensis]|uniref:Type 2 lanthipeptide synthetase LanM family protein n=1 Tax=Amycolatopsis minnesotensis TaxID=337894 RepID=A0ABN2SNN8_9PSEU